MSADPSKPGVFAAARFTDFSERTLNAKLRQAGRALADHLQSLPNEERAEWLQWEYPGGLNAGKALLEFTRDSKEKAPSRAVEAVCREMWSKPAEGGSQP